MQQPTPRRQPTLNACSPGGRGVTRVQTSPSPHFMRGASSAVQAPSSSLLPMTLRQSPKPTW